VLVGLSGGPDSVCLLTILHKLAAEFNIVLFASYIDHGLRPEETPAEADFCKRLCLSLGIPFTVKYIDVKSYAKDTGLSKQEAARELRYRAFDEALAYFSADILALGHNANDQAETVLMRLFRGAGPSGLSGIPPVRGRIVRPLIEAERSEIENFLEDNRTNALQTYIVDSSNLKDEYLRNRIRRLIIPSAGAGNKHIIKTITRTADILRDEERFLGIMVTKALMKLITKKTDTAIELFSSPMEAMDTVIVRRVLRRAVEEIKGLRGIGFTHIEDMVGLITKGRAGDRINLPGGLRVIKGYATIIITTRRPERLGDYVIEKEGDIIICETSFVVGVKKADRVDVPDYGDGKKTAVLDAGKLSFPLLIRARLPGDFFYPLGFGKRKKLQDFFVDEKVPRDERDSVPILTSGSDIVWVMGHRPDERFRVDNKTSVVLKFTIKPVIR